MAVLCRISSFLLLGASWPNLRGVHRTAAHWPVQPGNISKNKNMQRIRKEMKSRLNQTKTMQVDKKYEEQHILRR